MFGTHISSTDNSTAQRPDTVSRVRIARRCARSLVFAERLSLPAPRGDRIGPLSRLGDRMDARLPQSAEREM
ncbi:hypothetical protein ASH04_25635 [Rhodococcus sp. Leaf233]|nr:hypothetical protein ASH04_25635 [Rhodococcus sp. Leaf233]